VSLAPAFLDELRARVALSPVVGRRVKLVRAGREWKGCCPFHNEKTPSFYVNDDKGFYHCFGCGAHGDVIRFLTEQEGLPFMDAVKQLAAQAGMEVPAPSPQAQQRSSEAEELMALTGRAADWFGQQLAGAGGAEARAYLERRGVSATMVKAFGLGFAPGHGLQKALGSPDEARLLAAGLIGRGEDGTVYERFRGRLMFPIRDRRGRVVGFGGRALGDVQPKYLNSADGPLFDKGRLLYNLDRAGPAARKAGRLVVVEGYMDVIGVACAGLAELVAPLGTAMTETQLELAWRLVDAPILCFDGDAAGSRAALRACLRALPLLSPGKSLQIAALPRGEDPDDLVRRGGASAFEAVLQAARPLVEHVWRAEADSVAGGVGAGTPEARAAVRARLRAHVETIVHPDVRALYRSEFDQRFEAAYLTRKARPDRAFGRGAGAARPLALLPVSDGLRAQAAARGAGGDAPEHLALVAGLIANPWLADRHGETVAALPLGVGMAARLRDAVLTAAALAPGLEAAALHPHFHAEGLVEAAESLCRINRLRLRFCVAAAADEREGLEAEFASLLRCVVERPQIEAELARATREFVGSGSEADFGRQQRLRAERDALQETLMRLAESGRAD
jgi:DNA primase